MLTVGMLLGEITLPFIVGQTLLRVGAWPIPWILFASFALGVMIFSVLMFFLMRSREIKEIARTPLLHTEDNQL